MSKIDEILHKALEIGWEGVKADKWRLDNSAELEMAAQAIRNATTPEALKDVEGRISLLRHSLEKSLER